MLTELDLAIRQGVPTETDSTLKWWLWDMCKEQVSSQIRYKVRRPLMHPLANFPPSDICQSAMDQIQEDTSNADRIRFKN